jgi:hypothetical protein
MEKKRKVEEDLSDEEEFTVGSSNVNIVYSIVNVLLDLYS